MNRWVLLAGLLLTGLARGGELPTAGEVLKETGVWAGLAVVVGTTDGALEAALARPKAAWGGTVLVSLPWTHITHSEHNFIVQRTL